MKYRFTSSVLISIILAGSISQPVHANYGDNTFWKVAGAITGGIGLYKLITWLSYESDEVFISRVSKEIDAIERTHAAVWTRISPIIQTSYQGGTETELISVANSIRNIEDTLRIIKNDWTKLCSYSGQIVKRISKNSHKNLNENNSDTLTYMAKLENTKLKWAIERLYTMHEVLEYHKDYINAYQLDVKLRTYYMNELNTVISYVHPVERQRIVEQAVAYHNTCNDRFFYIEYYQTLETHVRQLCSFIQLLHPKMYIYPKMVHELETLVSELKAVLQLTEDEYRRQCNKKTEEELEQRRIDALREQARAAEREARAAKECARQEENRAREALLRNYTDTNPQVTVTVRQNYTW